MNFEKIINEAWEQKETITKTSHPDVVKAIKSTIDQVDQGIIRVAEKKGSEWVVNQWIKKAILLSFRTNEMQTLAGPYATWWDKVRGKTAGWGREEHLQAGFRMVPNGVVRHGAYIGKNVVLMPSFVNLGAYVDEGTMVDTWTTVGSCAQIVLLELDQKLLKV
jgi:2,3,4,5-tetrahydropyridine-2,6-dicarboxylate N-succinyltransferase